MPGRLIPLINGQIYHVVNRSIASQPVFSDWRSNKRAIESMFYYQNIHPPIKYSLFLKQASENRRKTLKDLKGKAEFLVEIIAYCYMPSHFHFLLKQKVDNGISKFVGNFTNSYTRYFNTKIDRHGPIFQGNFKAIRIETDEQLLHVSRYIHLNPFSSYLVKKLSSLENYPYSSFREYSGKTNDNNCQKEIILNYFKVPINYNSFVLDQADYQKCLEENKHLWLEKPEATMV